MYSCAHIHTHTHLPHLKQHLAQVKAHTHATRPRLLVPHSMCWSRYKGLFSAAGTERPPDQQQQQQQEEPQSFILLGNNNMSCMRWLHQKNFKQLSVRPLRPHPCTVLVCMCVCTHTHTLTYLPTTTCPPSRSFCVSVGNSSNLPLYPGLFVDSRTDVSPRLLLSVPAVDPCPPESTAP